MTSKYENKIDKGEDITDIDSILELYKKTRQYWKSIFDVYTYDMKFYAGDQWDASVARAREDRNLSTLVYNQIKSKVKYIVNNVRNAVPAIKVRPGNDANENTANVINGIIIQCERDSDADSAKIEAFKSSVIGGLGAWEIILDDSLDGDIDNDGQIDPRYSRIVDPTTVLMDPNAKMQTFEDADFCFKINNISKKEFHKLYGEDAEISNIDNEYNTEDDSVQLIDYWFKHNGRVIKYIINGAKVLEKFEKYRGKYIPIILMHGEEIRIANKVEYHGIVYDVRDMQRMLNLAKSRTADELAMAPNGQWLVEADHIKAYPQIWQNNNVSNTNILPYTHGSDGSKPEHIDPFTASTGFQQIAEENNNDISAAIGIKDVSKDLPIGSSGKAIQLQMSQSDIGTFEFADNLNKAVRYAGKIILDLIQQYTILPQLRTIGLPDGSTQQVVINQPYEENGEIVHHDIAHGKYAVDVDVGPSYLSQRQEALDKMLDYLKLNPQQMSVVADLVFKLMDVPEAEEFVSRLRATIPPEILAASNASNLNGSDPAIRAQQAIAQTQQLQQQMEQMQQQMQQLQQINQQLTMEKQSKLQEIEADGNIKLMEIRKKLELEKAIEEAKMEHELQLAELKNQHEIQMEQIKAANTIVADKTKIADQGKVDIIKNQHEIDAKSEAEKQKIHEQTHSDIFVESMKADIADASFKRTNRDLEY